MTVIRKKRRHQRKQFAAIAASFAALDRRSQYRIQVYTDNLTGPNYVFAMLCSTDDRFRRIMRMKKDTYYALRNWLLANTGLKTSRISVDEKMMIFFHIVAQGSSIRVVSDRFMRSNDTVYRAFHQVLDALMVLARVIIRPVDDRPHRKIVNNGKFFPWFGNVSGALDGTHFKVRIEGNAFEREVWRNRKGKLSTNVLAACDFDGRFTYVLAGWEGSANDAKVFNNAVDRDDLVIPKQKYMLGDAGYATGKRILTPYRGTRYHLQEQAQAQLKPRTPEELYNLRHAQLRNAIERAFGRWKNTFRIFKEDPPCLRIDTMMKAIYATAGLCNFLLEYGEMDPDEPVELDEEAHINDEDQANDFSLAERQGGVSSPTAGYRDQIAKRMWDSYLKFRKD
ncbi:hypothetical protein DL769_009926 [Monosporascus sp. CRB-8-3]|nr:hypothetical protein DL769_009926 [Monosporascus sp. CRB-8-3]